jgi:putative membrane protein
MVSQGASKAFYYVGAFLLTFVPGLRSTRGGAAWMVRGLHASRGAGDYYMVLAAIAIAAAAVCLLIEPLTRGAIRVSLRCGYRRLSWLALAVAVALVAGMTGWAGLLVMAVATGIGLLPVLFGSRRMNALGIILLPMACQMSGVGAAVAGWLGLLPL